MVQLKYFGDDRDYFKYDLITSILKDIIFENYVFIPMLTNEPHSNKEGEKRPKEDGGKSKELYLFIGNRSPKRLSRWKGWLNDYVKNYKTVEPVDETFFKDDARDRYWGIFAELLKEKNALIFLDPDTGVESGAKSYLKGEGEKYILNKEITLFYDKLDSSSVLMIYQHLQRNRTKHEGDVSKKLEQLKASNKSAFVCAYREKDLAFLFIAKDSGLFDSLYSTLKIYYDKSEQLPIYKSLHVPQK